MVMREVDEDLAIFLGMRNNEKEKNDHIIENTDEFDESTEPIPDVFWKSDQSGGDDNFLDLEIDKNDYDWLSSPLDSSLPAPVQSSMQDSLINQTEISNEEESSTKSKLSKIREGSSTVNVVDSSASTNKRPSSSSGNRKPTSIAPKMTKQPLVPAKSKPSSKPTFPCTKTTSAQSRSSTPTRNTQRSSTPSSRPSILVTSKSSSMTKMPPTMSKNSTPYRGTSPTVRNRPSKSLDLSQEGQENPKLSIPKRTVLASRGRPMEDSTKSKPRQKSCSPAKVRLANSMAHKIGSGMLTRSRGHRIEGEDVNPVLMGTKMVERVVNMRKLAPPKQEEYASLDNVKKSSKENSGFGRSLSNKSLEMAIRHMDIRRCVADNIYPIASGVLSSRSAKSSRVGVADSSLTSSNDSFKSST